jgi:hypothetical protein
VKFQTLTTRTAPSLASVSPSIQLTVTAETLLMVPVSELIAYEEKVDLTRLFLTGGRRIEVRERIGEIERLVRQASFDWTVAGQQLVR